MQLLWQWAYSFALLPALWVALTTLSLFNAKVRRGIRGRRRLFPLLERQMGALQPGRRIWFHSSSMGEFEQAKPIIVDLKRRHPDIKVIASFFSPSGYEHSRRYPLADVVTYLPFDTRRSARRFVSLTRPDVAVMVRYDVWPNHIWELRRRNIPVMIANATMRRTTKRRIPIVRNFHHHVYNVIGEILTVSAADAEAFRFFRLDRPRIEAIGDTRFDQVSARSREARKRHLIPEGILERRRILVAGSTWPEDEEVLIEALDQVRAEVSNLLTIIVPHEPHVDHLEQLEQVLGGKLTSIRFSALNEYRGEQVIIVDSVGILLILYACAHIAYVGGSFRQGIHNVLEAAAYGVPVVFGPRHRNSQEPLMLVERGGGFVIENSNELSRTLQNLLTDESSRTTAGKRASAFVKSHTGATHRIILHLEHALQMNAHYQQADP